MVGGLNDANATDSFGADGRVSQSASRPRDLQTVLIHEIGHILGLGHNCAMTERERRSVDHLRHRLPLCTAAGPALRNAAMFPVESLATTPILRDLSPDDRKALCALYPVRVSPKR